MRTPQTFMFKPEAFDMPDSPYAPFRDQTFHIREISDSRTHAYIGCSSNPNIFINWMVPLDLLVDEHELRLMQRVAEIAKSAGKSADCGFVRLRSNWILKLSVVRQIHLVDGGSRVDIGDGGGPLAVLGPQETANLLAAIGLPAQGTAQ